MLNLLDAPLNMIATIMHYVLIGTIVLGCLILLVFVVMIAKRMKYNSQMRKNKKQKEKIIKKEPLEDEKTL